MFKKSKNLLQPIITLNNKSLTSNNFKCFSFIYIPSHSPHFQHFNMKYHERLFLSRHTAMGGVEKVLQYLTSHLPNTFQHELKTIKDCEMLSFLRGVLQIYLEFWNSSDPFQEYIPDFTKPSMSIQQEWENMVAEIVSLLKHIRSCQFLLNINTVEKMDELQKLNNDLLSILDDYFNTNIWASIQ